MLTITRKKLDDRMAGTFYLPDGSEHHTIELPWRDNQVNVSCIPEGEYFFERDEYGKHQWFKILDVPNRTHIEMHVGTKPSHSNGCILMPLETLEHMMAFYGDVGVKYRLRITSCGQ